MTVLLVLAGGGAGAGLRYTADRWIQARLRRRFPFGTLTVNLVGCFVLGLVAGAVAHSGWSPRVYAVLGTGLCGGLTTFSTFSVEVVNELRGGLRRSAAIYLAISVGGAVVLAQAGWALT